MLQKVKINSLEINEKIVSEKIRRYLKMNILDMKNTITEIKELTEWAQQQNRDGQGISEHEGINRDYLI